MSTALAWRDTHDESPTMATHDKALALASGAAGSPVIGV
jgi:hypothetical protein